jgi:hypothetical protein
VLPLTVGIRDGVVQLVLTHLFGGEWGLYMDREIAN